MNGGDSSTGRVIVDCNDMPALMADADLAVTAGGTTVWELAFMGLPALTIILAENQRSNGDALQKLGIAQNLGWHAGLSPEHIADALKPLLEDRSVRCEMSRRGRDLVDGLGSLRVWLRLNEEKLGLRRAAESDSRLIWEWASHPAVRAVSFQSDPIPWETHAQWFNAKLSDPNCHLWIGTNGNQQAIGQVRFDLDEGEGTISVSLDAMQRGHGVGTLLIWTACRKLFGHTATSLIHAYIKPDNIVSIRAFEKAGFKRMGESLINECRALHLQLTREMAAT